MNKITISGKVENKPELSYKAFNENFYSFAISSLRTSGTADVIKCIAPEIIAANITEGDNVIISGEVRTQNVNSENGKRKLRLYVFCKDIQPYSGGDINCVEIWGYTCKEATYRATPLGREITDAILACNRVTGKSDYIPCIAWGRNARRLADMGVGAEIHAIGRLQSRDYTKKFDDGTEQSMVTYELSLSKLEKVVKEE